MEVYEIKKYDVVTLWELIKGKAEGGGRLQAVKSMTVPGKCSATSDSDWTVFPFNNGDVFGSLSFIGDVYGLHKNNC